MKRLFFIIISMICMNETYAQENIDLLLYKIEYDDFRRSHPSHDIGIMGYDYASAKITKGKMECSCASNAKSFINLLQKSPGKVVGNMLQFRSSKLSKLSNEKWIVYEKECESESFPIIHHYEPAHTVYVAIKKDFSELKTWSEPSYNVQDDGDPVPCRYGTLKVFKRISFNDLVKEDSQRSFLQ